MTSNNQTKIDLNFHLYKSNKMTYQVFIKNRNYTEWDFKDINNEDIIDITAHPVLQNVNPLQEKMFSRDIIYLNEKDEMVIKQSVLKDMSTGREVGDKSLKNINKNFQKTQLVGMRYLATYMHPDPINPSKIFVLGCITVEFANIAKDIRNQMLTAAQVQDQLDFKHKEAMLRFEAVERDYLKQREVELQNKGYIPPQK